MPLTSFLRYVESTTLTQYHELNPILLDFLVYRVLDSLILLILVFPSFLTTCFLKFFRTKAEFLSSFYCCPTPNNDEERTACTPTVVRVKNRCLILRAENEVIKPRDEDGDIWGLTMT